MRYAIVKDSLVANIVEWSGNSEFIVDGELIPADDNAWIGGEYVDGAFVARVVEPHVPTYTEQRAAAYGSLESQIEFITENGLDAWQAKVAEIKALYPKPE